MGPGEKAGRGCFWKLKKARQNHSQPGGSREWILCFVGRERNPIEGSTLLKFGSRDYVLPEGNIGHHRVSMSRGERGKVKKERFTLEEG